MKLGGCIDLNMSYTVPQKFLSLKFEDWKFGKESFCGRFAALTSVLDRNVFQVLSVGCSPFET